MHETDADRKALEELISRSIQDAGDFLRSSFQMPKCSLSADQLVRKLEGVVTLALGTVTSDGQPRVAPVVGIFYRGRFFIPTVRDSLRARHIRRNPAISLSIYEVNDFAVIVHGTAKVLGQDDSRFSELVEIQIKHDAGDVRTWGDAVFLEVCADRLYTFARYPDRFPGEAPQAEPGSH
jgi:hypothetical protein